MLEITSIKDGIVIDHIKAGYGIKIFNYLNLKDVDYSVALIMNVFSNKLGKKDIIKIANKEINVDFTVLGLIDPTITINIIENEKIKEKLNLELPERVEDVIKCKNPRCITSIEKYIPHVFYLIDRKKVEYKCKYCDEICKVVEE
ncbi:aspartate carbamoyltransferase regulatory subunit [Clostridium cochlearium]|jgi:aspartate carbamoyltransferase regulatory subunit|uniref:Aspartate carbamoyltransferase n=1 Tax=Clostridium cochlearium TaxID=1494 RepID=A0A240AX14_CLOCO|nr:aspartate carbamoyltransferase regulatory subunit [Clostridium cochlearium]NSJ91494.1 aspartate carbamoyltransferase regulatory subunit [Coprococcus sp. MSK.21.13]MBE6065864.1 aspartate carbamoyltransferase regulatory subunit [Clostridium cochlearium]MBU5268630.1 aspartate carbamoyltransferase regulatory subunit [Clostridium cochlearium]MCG4571631.1 aspartate carbamoyltransferase regulatory subunit [Clostridium cochlearium]MCG4580189.1 aspartate carbamoyltransferase regulatory subunit [Clos